MTKQSKITVSFRENQTEKELLEWIQKKSAVIGVANFIKQTLYDIKLEEEKGNK